MADQGDAQAERAKQFLRKLGYEELIAGETNIKKQLQLKVNSGATANCADIVAFRPNLKHPVGAIVCESKGTDVEHALVQLGNVAATLVAWAEANKKRIDITLLVYRSTVRRLDIGDSPGPGYVVGEANNLGMRTLIDAGTAERRPTLASAKVDMKRLDVRLTRWGDLVAKLPVYVYAESWAAAASKT